jgi:hypothetical protein
MTLDILVDRRLYEAHSTILALNSALGSNWGFLQGSWSSIPPFQPPIPFRQLEPKHEQVIIFNTNLRHASSPFDYIIFRMKERIKKCQAEAWAKDVLTKNQSLYLRHQNINKSSKYESNIERKVMTSHFL